MNKKLLLFIISAIIVVAIFLLLYQPLSCQSLYNEIENDLDKANYCQTDSDCDVLILGGSYIEFGCYHFINKEVDKEKFYDKMSIYNQECSLIINKCAPAPISKCVSGKCVG